jgi:hypothetical protein
MTRIPTAVILVLSLHYAGVPSIAAGGADVVGKPVELVTTDHVNFASGGLIRIDGSYGTLNIEGWDKAEVEVTVTKSRPLRFGDSPKPDDDKRRLESIGIKTALKSPTELTISTTLPSVHRMWLSLLPRTTTNDVDADYEIHVPRDSRLAIQHGAGFVQVRGVTGDIQATAGRADILLWLPLGAYSVDAKTKFGIVSSELDGTASNQHLIGEHFARANPAPSHRLDLRVGFGGITIRQIPPEE